MQGGLPPLAWGSCSPEARLVFSPFLFFFHNAHHQRGSSQPRSFSVTSWQLLAPRAPRPSWTPRAPRPSWMVPSGRNSLLPDSKHTCSHDVTLRISKQAPRFEGFPTRTHVLCSSELYKHARVENPSGPNSESSLASVRPRDRLTSTAGVSGPGFTPASEHVAVSCAARHEPRARRRANPGRFPMQLRPLLSPCPSVAVVVAIPPTHTCVSRRLHTTT